MCNDSILIILFVLIMIAFVSLVIFVLIEHCKSKTPTTYIGFEKFKRK